MLCQIVWFAVGLVNIIKGEEYLTECYDINKNLNTSTTIFHYILPRKPDCGRQTVQNSSEFPAGLYHPGEFPWLVHLDIKRRHYAKNIWDPEEPWQFWASCGGTLITDRFLLTASYCVDQHLVYEHDVTARMGKWSMDQDCMGSPSCERQQAIGKKTRQFRLDSIESGIAMLRLVGADRPIKFDDYIRPICLPLSCYWQEKDLECHDLTVASWGDVNLVYSIGHKAAQKFNVEVQGDDLCHDIYGRQHFNGFSHFCADSTGWDDGSFCLNTTGGPAVLKEVIRGQETFYLMGILNSGRNCPNADGTRPLPMKFTRVTNFIKWILERIYL